MQLPLTSDQRKWLKGAHVMFSALWLGAAGVLTLLTAPGMMRVETVGGMTELAHQVDTWIIIPFATCVLATGVLYGVGTKWGFFDFQWVTLKWIATVASVAFGALALGPWIDHMRELAAADPVLAMSDPAFQAAQTRVFVLGGAQALVLASLVFLSIFKPWGRRA